MELSVFQPPNSRLGFNISILPNFRGIASADRSAPFGIFTSASSRRACPRLASSTAWYRLSRSILTHLAAEMVDARSTVARPPTIDRP